MTSKSLSYHLIFLLDLFIESNESNLGESPTSQARYFSPLSNFEYHHFSWLISLVYVPKWQVWWWPSILLFLCSIVFIRVWLMISCFGNHQSKKYYSIHKKPLVLSNKKNILELISSIWLYSRKSLKRFPCRERWPRYSLWQAPLWVDPGK